MYTLYNHIKHNFQSQLCCTFASHRRYINSLSAIARTYTVDGFHVQSIKYNQLNIDPTIIAQSGVLSIHRPNTISTASMDDTVIPKSVNLKQTDMLIFMDNKTDRLRRIQRCIKNYHNFNKFVNKIDYEYNFVQTITLHFCNISNIKNTTILTML